MSTGSENIAAFNRIAAQNNWIAVPAMGVTQDAKTISGFEHMRELVRWAFDAKQGEVSPVITVDNEYFFVAAVAGIHEEGIATLEEKRAEIESILTLEKKKERIYNQIREELASHTTLEVGQKLPEETSQNKQGSLLVRYSRQIRNLWSRICSP